MALCKVDQRSLENVCTGVDEQGYACLISTPDCHHEGRGAVSYLFGVHIRTRLDELHDNIRTVVMTGRFKEPKA